MNDKLLANIRFHFAQCVFTSKCHFKAYDRLMKEKKCLSNFIKFISIATLFVLILQIIGLQGRCQALLNILSYVGLLLTGISLAFEMFNKDDVIQEIARHKQYAEKYNTLRDKYMDLIEETKSSTIPDERIKEKRDALQKRYSKLGKNSPQTTGDDYMKAQSSLGLTENNNEEFTWPDNDIDKFLPERLRLNNQTTSKQ